ncbi:carbohydrate ABC transporter permease [Cohnella candidum]|uniref:Sugar ABC transporter permease n=1 Tax=Cohnella candidum TaxID=2674991 RepID=A0A3G3JXQ7_9BACL|nr:sugar ABC transporter permease [Cohnella candidum]AYQ73025.1 sugar ABC transporter permease [Cohnella candidum]
MRLHKCAAPYVFISPYYVLFLFFVLYPLLSAFYASFTEWNGIKDPKWIGFRNYSSLFKDDIFLQSLWNGVIIFFMYVPLLLFLSLVFAVILNSAFVRLKGFFRAAYFIPYITSLVAVGFTFRMLFGTEYGYINELLTSMGLAKTDWLGTIWGARITLAILVIWRWLGYNMVIMLAGLQNIPSDLYEAARIDGAGPVQSFFRITIPMMAPIIMFTSILSTIGTFQLFAEPLVLTRGSGGPENSIMSVIMYVYNQSFSYLKFGYASAAAYVFFLLMFVLTLMQIRVFRQEN